MRCLTLLLCALAFLGCGEDPAPGQPPAPDPVAALSPALRSEFPEERDAALKALAEFGPDGAAAVPDLLFLMRGADASVREPAEQVLLSIGEAAIPGLLAALRADDWQERAPAVRCLNRMGPEVGEQVVALLDEPFLRGGAVDYLLQSEDLTGVRPGDLKSALTDRRPGVRLNAIAVIMKLDGPWEEAVPLLRAMVDDPDDEVVLRMIMALAGPNTSRGRERHSAPAAPELVKLLEHENRIVRTQAADGLGRVVSEPSPEVLSAVIAALKDPEPGVRQGALRAISRLGAGRPECLDLLLQAFSDEDPYVRATIARALAAFGEAAAVAVPALIEALHPAESGNARDRSAAEELRDCALRALESIGPAAKAAGPALVELLTHEDDRLAGDAARVLAVLEVELTQKQQLLAFRRLQGSWAEEEYFLKLLVPTAVGDPEVMADLIEILSEPRRGGTLPRFVRKLLNAGDAADPVVPVVVKSLSGTPTMPVSLAAKFFTGREQAAVPLLRQALIGADPAGRLRVLWVLCLLKADEGALVPALRAAFGSEDSEMRSFAVELAGSVGPDLRALVPDLILLLRDEDDGVFTETIGALNGMGNAAKSAVPALSEVARTSDSEWRRELAGEWAELFSQR